MPSVPVVWSPGTLLHQPGSEVWVGVTTPGTEIPARVEVIRDALAAAGHELVEAVGHDDAALSSVHDPRLVMHLRDVHSEWLAAGFAEDPGQDRVVPYFFPTAAMLGPLPSQRAAAVHARAGQFCYDTMTLVGPGTYAAARAAVDCALTAVDLIGDGATVAYALCRPPGHHVTREGYGGSCYLNNAALAAQRLRDHGAAKVAVIDLDAHHGNGTAAIFYERDDVLYGSVHVDPGAGWFPHVVGFADETGSGEGAGTTRNEPLSPGSDDAVWCEAVARLVASVTAFSAEAVVVSLGVDAAADDPESPLLVSADGYRSAGRMLGQLELPSVVVQEGGYHLPSLGGLVCAYLDGHASEAIHE
ncbi:MAG: histone deacetylase family protein [Nocardioidaceae bacterium]